MKGNRHVTPETITSKKGRLKEVSKEYVRGATKNRISEREKSHFRFFRVVCVFGFDGFFICVIGSIFPVNGTGLTCELMMNNSTADLNEGF